MKQLNKFNTPVNYLCSVVTTKHNGNIEEVFLNAAITDNYLKMVRITNFGSGFVVDNLEILKNSRLVKVIQSAPTYIKKFRVYSVPTLKPYLLIDELVLIHDIPEPTIQSLETTLGIPLL